MLDTVDFGSPHQLNAPRCLGGIKTELQRHVSLGSIANALAVNRTPSIFFRLLLVYAFDVSI